MSKNYKQLVDRCNNFLTGNQSTTCLPFFVENNKIGYLRDDVIKEIKKFPDIFLFTKNNECKEKVVLNSSLQTFEERSQKIAEILELWRDNSIFVTLNGWRNEDYNVYNKFGEKPVLKMERSATGLFGVVQYGVHINGYVNHPDKGVCVWVARRSATKQTFPNKLDQMVAGGLASGQSIMECARKECEEEASITDPAILDKLVNVGTVSYYYEDERGLFRECQFVMDLELPLDFTPTVNDSEVQSFQLVTVEELKTLITKEEFKFNCALVNLNFMIRHGFIHPDNEPNYTYLVEMMHAKLQ